MVKTSWLSLKPSSVGALVLAHWRRDFHDVGTARKSEIGHEVLKRISKLYDIEREIAGKSADIRHAARLTSN